MGHASPLNLARFFYPPVLFLFCFSLSLSLLCVFFVMAARFPLAFPLSLSMRMSNQESHGELLLSQTGSDVLSVRKLAWHGMACRLVAEYALISKATRK